MVEDGGDNPGSVAIDIHCDGKTVERLRLSEGETFDAEVYCSDYSIEVVSID